MRSSSPLLTIGALAILVVALAAGLWLVSTLDVARGAGANRSGGLTWEALALFILAKGWPRVRTHWATARWWWKLAACAGLWGASMTVLVAVNHVYPWLAHGNLGEDLWRYTVLCAALNAVGLLVPAWHAEFVERRAAGRKVSGPRGI